MQLTIVLDGSESDTQLRSIASAVLGLAGETFVSIASEFSDRKPTLKVEDVNRAVKAVAADIKQVFKPEELGEVTPGVNPMTGFIPPIPGGAEQLPPLDLGSVGFGAAADPLPTVPDISAKNESKVPALPPGVGAAVPEVPVVPSNPVSGDRDVHGLPWDARIHAESKAKIADGSWRKRRNVDETVYKTVEAELRTLVGAPPPRDPGVVPALPNGAVVKIPTPTIEPETVLGKVMKMITPHLQSEANPNARLTHSDIAQCAEAVGLLNEKGTGSVMALNTRPELANAFIEHINRRLAS